MTARVGLGHVWAVPVAGTASFFPLGGLVAGLAGWQLSQMRPGYSAVAYAGAGLLCSALLLWAVLAHEAAHVAAARHYGARVQGVTLSFLGGKTAISGEPGSPWQGLVVAGAGPAASTLCGAVCFGVAVLGAQLRVEPLLWLSPLWVAMMCFLLAVLNLIPAAPLDGGHVFQALVWAVTGRRSWGNVVAARAGQLLGVASIAAAFWLALRGTSLLSVGAMTMVGLAVGSGASALIRTAGQRDRLGAITAGELAEDVPAAISDVSDLGPRRRGLRRTAAVLVAEAQEPIVDVLERAGGRLRRVAVMEGPMVVGIVDPERIQAALASPRAENRETATDLWPGARSRLSTARQLLSTGNAQS